MLDLESHHPQSVTEPHGKPGNAIDSRNPVNMGLESSIGAANALLADDELQTVERVLPQSHNSNPHHSSVHSSNPHSSSAHDSSLHDSSLHMHSATIQNSTVQNSDTPPLEQLSSPTLHYLQGVHTKTGAFIRTNLPRTEKVRTTENGMVWLMGRSRNCAVVFPDPAVSRCHAVVGYDIHQGFYIMDVGSSNGTFLNQQRLVAMQRHTLKNSDVITISHIKIEIFLLNQD